MNREYKNFLEAQSAYCNCKPLQDLVRLGKRAESLEKKCGFHSKNLDLCNPQPEDRNALIDYEKTVQELENASESYNQLLTQLIQNKQLKLIFHNQTKKRQISYNEFCKLKKEDNIFTVHCSNCNKQIRVVE